MIRKALVALLVLLVFLSVSAVPAKAETLENGGIIMQTFYWDVPGGGIWWDTITQKIPDWTSAGILAI